MTGPTTASAATPQVYTCANCPGKITTADDLITVKVPGAGTKPAHRTCPPPVAPVTWQPVETRDPGIAAPPIALEPGQRIRIVFEGTVDELEAGFVGPIPVVSNDIDQGVRLPHWLLRASRIERLEPTPTDAQTDPASQAASPNQSTSPIHSALLRYIESRGIPMPVYTNGSKIIEEAHELREAVAARDVDQIKEETADVVIVAAVAAQQFHFTVEEALEIKIAKDRGRGPKPTTDTPERSSA